MSEHFLIPGDFFTREQWRGPLAPFIDDVITKPGGVLIVAVEVAPRVRNYPSVTFGVFDSDERAALKTALTKLRKRRATRAQAPRHDLAPCHEGQCPQLQ